MNILSVFFTLYYIITMNVTLLEKIEPLCYARKIHQNKVNFTKSHSKSVVKPRKSTPNF